MTITKLIMIFSLIFFWLSAPLIAEQTPTIEAEQETRRYTFSWQFHDGSDLTPRGGTSVGADIQLAAKPSPAWKSLQEEGLTKFEKDRRAILAMTGEYRASFDFIETLGFFLEHEPSPPYQSWATEYIFVVEDRKDFISLQHILVMIMKQDDGELTEPYVVKHWRQDWSYEDRKLNVFLGNNSWTTETLTRKEVKGKWSQAVFQVDDSPRYESQGEWLHAKGYSSWTSDRTWRPLPRREKTVRDDYDVLIGTNRHTIIPNGWSQEEDNLKVSIGTDIERHFRGKLNREYLVRAREVGLNRYERIVHFDFSPAMDYWAKTESFWSQIRAGWQKIIVKDIGYRMSDTEDGESFLMNSMIAADKIVHAKQENQINEKEIVGNLFDRFVEVEN